MEHDKRFKSFFRRFFREFLELFFPHFAAQIDWGRPIEFLDKEIDDLVRDKDGRSVDVLIKVHTRKDSADQGAARMCLFHIEVESRKSRPALKSRIFEYYSPLYDQNGLPIMPIAVYLNLGGEGLGWQEFEIKCLGVVILTLRFPYIGLPGLDGVEYSQKDNPAAWALSGLMRIPEEEKARIKAENLRRVEVQKMGATERRILVEFVEVYSTLTPEQQQEFNQLLQTKAYMNTQTSYRSAFDEARDEREKQLRDAVEAKLIKALEAKFESLSQRSRNKLARMNHDELLEVFAKLSEATTKKELGI